MQNDPTATGPTCNAAAGFVGCRQYRVNLLDHSDAIESGRPDLWGDDYIAGGAGADEIWGQLGADVIQGDGYVDGLVLVAYAHDLTAASPRPASCRRPGTDADRRLARPDDERRRARCRHPVGRAAHADGDDYIEGNGGNDTIFGGLGQDDIVGDSSDLYISGLRRPARPDRRPARRWRIVGVSADGSALTLAGRSSCRPRSRPACTSGRSRSARIRPPAWSRSLRSRWARRQGMSDSP